MKTYLIVCLLFSAFTNTYGQIAGGQIAFAGGAIYAKGCPNENLSVENVVAASGGTSAQYSYSWEDSVQSGNGWTALTGVATSTAMVKVYSNNGHYYRRKVTDLSNPTEYAFSNIVYTQRWGATHGLIELATGGTTVTINTGVVPPAIVNVQAATVEYPPMYYDWEKKQGSGSWMSINGAFSQPGYQPLASPGPDTFYYRRYVLDGCSPVDGSTNIITVIVKNTIPVKGGKITIAGYGQSNIICWGQSTYLYIKNVDSATGGSSNFIYKWEITSDGITWNEAVPNYSADPLEFLLSYFRLSYNQYAQYRRKAIDVADASNIAYSDTVTLLSYWNDAGSIAFFNGGDSASVPVNTTPPLIANTVFGQSAYGGVQYFWEKLHPGNPNWLYEAGGNPSYQPIAESVAGTYYYRRRIMDGCGDGPVGSNELKLVVTDVMPVTWISFNALNSAAYITLNWKVTNEINCRGYEIMRSTNGSDYAVINFTERNAINDQGNTYQYYDKSIPANCSTIYYKIRQVDRDGKFSYSRIVKVPGPKERVVYLYPNPAHSMVQMIIPKVQTGKASIKITDVAGRLLSTQAGLLSSSGVTIDVSKLAQGSYFIRVTINGEEYTSNLLVQ